MKVPADVLERTVAVLKANGHDTSLIEEVYKEKDENCIPPVYLLSPNLIGEVI